MGKFQLKGVSAAKEIRAAMAMLLGRTGILAAKARAATARAGGFASADVLSADVLGTEASAG